MTLVSAERRSGRQAVDAFHTAPSFLCVKGQRFKCRPEGHSVSSQYSFFLRPMASCAQWRIPASVASWVAPRGETTFPAMCQPARDAPGGLSQHHVDECLCYDAPNAATQHIGRTTHTHTHTHTHTQSVFLVLFSSS